MTPYKWNARALACNDILTLRLNNYEVINAKNEFCPVSYSNSQ